MTKSKLVTGFSLAASALVLAAFSRPAIGQQTPVVVVHKSPSCGCCAKWVDHAKAAGFQTNVHDMDDVDPIKDKSGVPASLRSCHTALVGGYVIEGHVPADLIQKLLKEQPKILGLAVGGMVSGSPGMEGGPKEAYDVIAFDKDGKTTVYARR